MVVPSSGASSRWACWISVTTMPRLKNVEAARIRMAALTQSAVERNHRIHEVEAAGRALAPRHWPRYAASVPVPSAGRGCAASRSRRESRWRRTGSGSLSLGTRPPMISVTSGFARRISMRKQPPITAISESTKPSSARMPNAGEPEDQQRIRCRQQHARRAGECGTAGSSRWPPPAPPPGRRPRSRSRTATTARSSIGLG